MLTTWIVGGGLLVALEVVVPGMVLGFLGASALSIALFIWLGWIDTWISALTGFFILSLVMLVGLRGLFQRYIGGDVERQSPDEELDAFGTIVEVVETIAPDKPGRVRFRGATWEANCYDHTIEAGRKATLVYRDNLVWVVEPSYSPDDVNIS